MTQATDILTETVIVTHTTLSDISGDPDKVTVTVKLDDDGGGEVVVEDLDSILEIPVSELDHLVMLLTKAQAIRDRLDPRF